jgi:hypothetical protein
MIGVKKTEIYVGSKIQTYLSDKMQLKKVIKKTCYCKLGLTPKMAGFL